MEARILARKTNYHLRKIMTITGSSPNMKAMYKSELAKAAGVNRTTLWRWLKNPLIQRRLTGIRLTGKQQKLPGKAVKIICEHYAIDID